MDKGYKKALELIAKEKGENKGSLRLSLLNLEKVPKEIVGLNHLKFLHLTSNNISDIRPLEKLTNLQFLALSGNQISDCNFLEKLTNLQILSLDSNNISDIQPLEKLINLQSLSLSSNKISDIQPLEKLINLQKLYLNGNQISDIRPLGKLTNLQFLALSGNQISDCNFLEKLTNLDILDLSNNAISELNFRSYPLSKLYFLSNNDIKTISYELIKSQEEKINPKVNSLIEIEQAIEYSKGIKQFFVNHQQYENAADLRDIESKLVRRKETFDPSIQDSSPSPILSNEEQVFLKKLMYEGNPLTDPPLEILMQDEAAIAKYFEDKKQQGIDHIYEAKMLVMGDGGAGKTSLVWKLKDLASKMPEEGNDRTKGIDIQAMPIDNLKDKDKPFLMNVWDFGGQGYYHSTHQFFLTKRSLYVLVNNVRINKTDFNHWLQTISTFSENSPVIIVENEVGEAKSELDLRGLQQHFSNIKGVYRVDLSNTEDGRLQKLIDTIKIEIQQLDHVGNELPKQWVKIREELLEVAKAHAHISAKEFSTICKQHKITEKDARQRLGDLLHDLGVFLHFRKDEVLKNLVILQNTWATKGVYEILDSEKVRQQKGYFTITQAEAIWDDTAFEEMHFELVRLMEKFELCYRIPYSTAPAAYISPNLLTTEKPDYNWENQQNLIIHYVYEFMPKGLLGRLMVRLHRYVKDINQMAWRNGCVFEYENTQAQVVETYGHKKLEIRLSGDHCVKLSSIIIREIDELNDGFKEIQVKKLLPCICSQCKTSDTPHFYTFKNLEHRKWKGKLKVECDLSFEDVDVLQILDGVYNAEAAKELTVKELIKKGRLKEAIDVYQEKNTDNAILLMGRYERAIKLFREGEIGEEELEKKRQLITKSLMEYVNELED